MATGSDTRTTTRPSLRGRWAALVVALAGVALIASDRVAARRVGDRPWIRATREDEWARATPTRPGEPWPAAAGTVVFPVVRFHFTPTGSRFDDVLMWVEREARVSLSVNWRALNRAGVTRDSQVLCDGTDVSLPALMDAVRARVTGGGGRLVPLGWQAAGGRGIFVSTAADVAAERHWRAQRAAAAGPKLRAALDRVLPYAELYPMRIDEALRFIGRLADVDIEAAFLSDSATRSAAFGSPATVENLIERLVRQTGDRRQVLRFKAEGERLIVFEDAEGR